MEKDPKKKAPETVPGGADNTHINFIASEDGVIEMTDEKRSEIEEQDNRKQGDRIPSEEITK